MAELAGLPRPVINRAQEMLTQLESRSREVHAQDEQSARQLVLFPEVNPLLDELAKLDLTSITPLEALNRLYQWQQRFGRKGGGDRRP